MPNLAVDVNSWARSACYPQGSFYPLSDGPSIRHRRITNPDFRPCSTCLSHSQARFCICTRRLISIQSERTFGRLRYSLGGDRPSQTAHLTRSLTQFMGAGYNFNQTRVVSQQRLLVYWRTRLFASHLSCTSLIKIQYQATVKLHGVFPSSCG